MSTAIAFTTYGPQTPIVNAAWASVVDLRAVKRSVERIAAAMTALRPHPIRVEFHHTPPGTFS